MISPKKGVPKLYRVNCRHPLSEDMLQALRSGVQLHDEPAPIVALACKQVSSHELLLTLGEGKYHQVKRMIAAAGNRVEALHREAIGGLRLPTDLPAGEWRWLDETDLRKLEGA
jgi:16S rRNA pseudouridine516 synthase